MFCCWKSFVLSLIPANYWSWAILVVCIVTLSCFRIRRFDISKFRFRNNVVGLFHPYCNAGGGGERVLWAIVSWLQENHPNLEIVIFTGDVDVNPEQIVSKISSTFNIALMKTPRFVFLKTRNFVEASKYPFFTLLGQSLGSVILGFEALCRETPDIFIDTMGYAFTLPLFKYLSGCRVACYVHYPTISSDMLSKVSSAEASFNNRQIVAKSSTLTSLKIIYYKLFAKLYGFVGSSSELVMVNSTWTLGHIRGIWNVPSKTFLVYPPCNTDAFQKLKLERSKEDKLTIISVAQFRPEKNHKLQISAFEKFTQMLPDSEKKKAKLILVGSCRNQEDERRVDSLKSLCQDLNVDFKLNVTFKELLQLMEQSNIGLHTMKDEHFGIGVVELMASGTIVVAHNSGGPKLDIVEDGLTGFLASDADGYAKIFLEVSSKNDVELDHIRQRARTSVAKFSDAAFEKSLTDSLGGFLK